MSEPPVYRSPGLFTYLGCLWAEVATRKDHCCRLCNGVIARGMMAYRPFVENSTVSRHHRICVDCAPIPKPGKNIS
jgi:hypothetical protein